METTPIQTLGTTEWRNRALRHRCRAKKWTDPMRDRRARREKHPIFDFLNTYYQLSLGKLEAWHPGFGVALEDCRAARRAFATRHYQFAEGTCRVEPSRIGGKERERLRFTAKLLAATHGRPPSFVCHGLHEWAMVYRGTMVRHRETVPFRIPQEEIDALVESRPLCCTHFDAFRHFSPGAQPLNRVQPGLWSREENEQPGCIHANMDLYKWAAKAIPWVGSDLLWDCFQLAVQAREIDMRASPYDLSTLGYAPITVETEAGRTQYEEAQRSLCKTAHPLRLRLLAALENVLAAAGREDHSHVDAAGSPPP